MFVLEIAMVTTVTSMAGYALVTMIIKEVERVTPICDQYRLRAAAGFPADPEIAVADLEAARRVNPLTEAIEQTEGPRMIRGPFSLGEVG